MAHSLEGNPFRGMAEAFRQSVQLEWGWVLLIAGAVLILCAAFMKEETAKEGGMALGPQDAMRPALSVTVFLFTLLVAGLLFRSGDLQSTLGLSSAGTGAQKANASHEAYLKKIKVAQADIRLLKAAVNSFNLDVGRYPTTQEGLADLLSRPSNADGWNGPYLKKDLPVDPWGNSYVYITPVWMNGDLSHYAIDSYGADGQPGGSGENNDITALL